MVRPLHAAIALAALVPIAIASGCGSSSSSSASTTAATTAAAPATTAPATTAPATTAPAATTPATTAPAAAASTVAVEADPNGALAYVQKTLTAKAGKTTFVFTNTSPVQHNLTLEKANTEQELGATNTITGATAKLTLTLPAGTYTYYCSVPGHEAAGMKGTLTVS